MNTKEIKIEFNGKGSHYDYLQSQFRFIKYNVIPNLNFMFNRLINYFIVSIVDK